MSNARTDVEVSADDDADDCLAAAAAAFVNGRSYLEGWDLSPRWTDDDTRETVTLSVPTWALTKEDDIEQHYHDRFASEMEEHGRMMQELDDERQAMEAEVYPSFRPAL